ncbi:MAG: SusD/RagB family nutrient-binding outer membrane lipoprotein [Tannerella sp.]|jgi:hypothetical protein|nr:SusD/RagB family nutrient-binding outer membrane lipoprotein [Tannerella sp.]
MKKIRSIIVLSFTAILLYTACSDEAFDKRFTDPSKTSTVTVEKLMTGTFEKGNKYTMPWYMRYFAFETQQMGRYSQIMGWTNGNGMYSLNDSYNNERWYTFYKVLAQYRLLEDTWNKMEDSQKPLYEVFKHITRIYVYDNLHQIVDIWGDVPFSEAGYVGLRLDIEASKPAYDKAEDLYTLMLSDLKTINSFLAGYSPTSIVNTQLKEQDYINGGDLGKWRIYCNSLRLRIASRAAENGPLTTEARGVIAEILGDPSTCPIVTANDENIQINFQSPDLTSMTGQHEEGIRGGFESWNGSVNRAGKAYLDQLKDDPRLKIIYDTNAEGEYAGMDPLMSSTEQDRLFNRPQEQGGNYFSAVDSGTFSRNNRFPGILITASEMDFIRAEAAQKWGISNNAEASFESAVQKSIAYYYYINSLGEYREPVTAPGKDEIEAFATKKWNDYSSKEEAIAVQRWVHHGMLQMVQAWSEYRKTGYPVLTFQEDRGSIDTPAPPARYRYTNDEKVNNTANYNAVQSKDGYYDKLFWAK